jgi:hypothetical protein
MAYASALGNLHAQEAVEPLLGLLAATQNAGARLELALSLARIVGDEHVFISLLRQTRTDPGTAMCQAVAAWRRRIDKAYAEQGAGQTLAECEVTLARGDLDRGSRLLAQALRQRVCDPTAGRPAGQAADLILTECAGRLGTAGAAQMEYVLLALHTLQTTTP